MFLSFRLLTEYRSFLWIRFFEYPVVDYTEFPSPYGVSFILFDCKCFYNKIWGAWWVSVSLRSIVHSMKNDPETTLEEKELGKFPSPYGVSFILSYSKKSLLLQYIFSVLSWEIFIFEFFLFISNKSILNFSFFYISSNKNLFCNLRIPSVHILACFI